MKKEELLLFEAWALKAEIYFIVERLLIVGCSGKEELLISFIFTSSNVADCEIVVVEELADFGRTCLCCEDEHMGSVLSL